MWEWAAYLLRRETGMLRDNTALKKPTLRKSLGFRKCQNATLWLWAPSLEQQGQMEWRPEVRFDLNAGNREKKPQSLCHPTVQSNHPNNTHSVPSPGLERSGDFASERQAAGAPNALQHQNSQLCACVFRTLLFFALIAHNAFIPHLI